ncbi:hypothetical protein EH165_03880 [Nakamurella antarctica]|uniref:Uncharacterized protein n=1 Tax=Nakamurella antarctica TaxID=1902245 RepID=A0A3G8ZTQ8_9ACTN|nr:hypothetical protein [Nakamurella antarctica]AZI57426.1 hypothetical protein EH165_03880 [Nakamurella antarctica]
MAAEFKGFPAAEPSTDDAAEGEFPLNGDNALVGTAGVPSASSKAAAEAVYVPLTWTPLVWVAEVKLAARIDGPSDFSMPLPSAFAVDASVAKGSALTLPAPDSGATADESTAEEDSADDVVLCSEPELVYGDFRSQWDSFGSTDVAVALDEFQDGWKDGRQKIIEEIESLKGGVDGALDDYVAMESGVSSNFAESGVKTTEVRSGGN